MKDVDADDQGEYRCEASKDGVVASDDFELTVIMPAICEHNDGTTWEEGEVYNPQVREWVEVYKPQVREWGEVYVQPSGFSNPSSSSPKY